MMRGFLSILAIMLLSVSMPVSAMAAADATVTPEEEAAHVSDDSLGGPEFATGEAENPIEAAEDHEGGGLPQLNVATYPSQIFWLMITFSVMYLAFSKMILPTIGSVVDGRDGKVKGDLQEAENFKKQAESIQAAYEKNLETARLQAVQAVQDVEATAKKKAADQIEQFRKRAENDMSAAEGRVTSAKDAAMGDMATVAAEIASVAAEKITGISTDMQNARAVVDSIAGKAKAA